MSNKMKPSSPSEFCRRISVPALKYESDEIKLEADIASLAGVCAVDVNLDKHQIVVCYDVTKTDYQTVIGALKDCGFPILNNWWSRRKMSWYEFIESNARENAKAPPPACCNKPPK